MNEKDILDEFEETEVHAETISGDFDGNGQKWKPFTIQKCEKCGKTPKIRKDFDFEDTNRYQIMCCGLSASGYSETSCIVEWNRKQDYFKTLNTRLEDKNG